MDWYMAIIYGIIQGLTEFLPVSSSGHLAIAQGLFGMNSYENYFTFDILLHLGTLAAVFIVYRRDILELIPSFFTLISKVFRGKFSLKTCTNQEKMVLFVMIATAPLLLAALFSDYVEVVYGYTKIIGAILIFNGVILLISDRIGKENIDIEGAKVRHPLIIGLCQVIAIFPGLSRSGSTITGGLFCGFERQFAVKFSFIMSIPAILGAVVLEIPKMSANQVTSDDILPYILGMLSALVFGLLAMKLLVKIAKKANFTVFSFYCFAVGASAIIFG